MEDRYLFKAKRTDNGEWVTGYYTKSIVNGSVFGYIRESIFGFKFIKALKPDMKKRRFKNMIDIDKMNSIKPKRSILSLSTPILKSIMYPMER